MYMFPLQYVSTSMKSNNSIATQMNNTNYSKNCVRILKVVMLFLICTISFLMLYTYAPYINISQFIYIEGYDDEPFIPPSESELVHDEYYELRILLKAVTMKDNTVILAYLNEAWEAPDSIFEIFLESFRIGNNTTYLLNHLLVVAIDNNAYTRCQTLVSHCYLLRSNESSTLAHQANFMTPNYLDLIWRRVAFLQTILTLGYNFIITDSDIVWFRDPLPHIMTDNNSDIQVSCDWNRGDEYDLNNLPNVGFLFARSNNRTIKFYEFWISLRHKYPNLHEQDAFNQVKHQPSFRELGVNIRFLDTNYFSGFCSPSNDFNKVCTMHANCCVGLDSKKADLKTTLENWKAYYSTDINLTAMSQPFHCSVPKECHI